MIVTVLLATPIAPAKTPWRRRMAIASASDDEVPNKVHDAALPSNDTSRTSLRPYLSAMLDHKRDVTNY